MTKQTSFEAAVANHVRTQIEIGAEKLGGMHEVVNNCILVMNEDYSSNDARHQCQAHEVFEENFESKVAHIEINHLKLNKQMRPDVEVVVNVKPIQDEPWNVSYLQMSVSDSDFTTYVLDTDPYDINANDPHWDTLTDLFMGLPTLRIAEY
jgi:hypothetical protein